MGLMDTGGLYAKFDTDGARVEGVVVEVEEYPAVYDGQPKLSKAGKRLNAYRIPLRQDDGETVVIDTFQWRLIKAIQDAVVASGLTDLVPGSRLAVWRTGTEKGGGTILATTFAAEVTPARSGLAPDDQRAAAENSMAAPSVEPQRPDHISAELWAQLSPDQQRAVAPAAPF